MKNQNNHLFREAQNKALDFLPRRHFLQQCGMGSLFGGGLGTASFDGCLWEGH